MGYRKAGINITLKSEKDSGFVFFIHGLFMTSHIMLPLAWHFRRRGYTAFCYDYPTRIRTVEQHGEELAGVLERLPDLNRPLHIVTHSMGGLLIRAALAKNPRLLSRIGRVVMITPPNLGSDVASFWFRVRWMRPLIVPLEDMRSESDSRIHSLPIPPMDFGIIAASHDGAVRLPYTHLNGERDRILLPSSHTMILFRRDTATAVEHFIETGHFAGN